MRGRDENKEWQLMEGGKISIHGFEKYRAVSSFGVRINNEIG